ncbi:MAG: Hint domain-containing protein [Acetobacteraceae bacterium]
MADTYTWSAASGDWFNAANWIPAQVPGQGAVALIGGNSTQTVAIGDIINGVTIRLRDGDVILAMNGGTIGAGSTVTDNGIHAYIGVTTSAAFDGTFTFAPQSAGEHLSVHVDPAATLSIGQAGTITADSGNIINFGNTVGTYTGTVSNHGLISAPGGSLLLLGGELYSDGTIAIGRGDLTLAGGLLSNTGRIVASGGTLAVTGGTLANDGSVVITGASMILNGGAINGNGTIAIGNGGRIFSFETIGAGQTIRFLDQTAHLQLDGSSAEVMAPIVDFQPGDWIWLPQRQANGVTYDPVTHTLYVTDASGVVTQFNLTTSGTPIHFSLRQGQSGPIVVSSDATRIWNGGTAAWYSAANWTTSQPAQASFPLAGDTMRIGSGLATISAADVAQFGVLNVQTIILSGSAGGAGGLSITNNLIGPDATVEVLGPDQFGLLQLSGNDFLQGAIYAGGHNGHLTIDFANAATLTSDGGVILSGSSSNLLLDGTGTFVNGGVVVVEGGLTIGSGVTMTNAVTSTGTIRLQDGGHVVLDGIVNGNDVEFDDSTGQVTIEDPGEFTGSILHMSGGNRINLPKLKLTSISYNSVSDILELISGTTIVGQIRIGTIDGYDGFNLASDGQHGSRITYAPTYQVLQPVMPVPFVAVPGTTAPLQDLLLHAFGTIPAGYVNQAFQLSYATAADLADWKYSYWNINDESVSKWLVNGTVIAGLPDNTYLPPNPPGTTVAGSRLADITLQAGNQITTNVFLQVDVGPQSQVAYWLETVDPHVASPTIYSGHVDAIDIVASALRYEAYFGLVPNDNDCASIAANIAAAAGASMPPQAKSTDPTANQEGGFWRIAYRASDHVNPVQDWGPLVLEGDIVRMGWTNGGHHATTVMATNADGSILVYDNGDSEDGQSVIGLHNVRYWTQTIPESITIYRLDPNHQFLVQGSGQAEFLQGSPYDDLIRPNGGADTIAGGAGNTEVQGSATALKDIAIIDWHQGDTLDITDMPLTGAAVSYDVASGLLHVSNQDTGQDVGVALPAGLPDLFQLTSVDGGTEVTLACFADGTRLHTTGGEVAVEDLRVGDVLLTVSDPKVPSRIIRWIGRRTVEPRRHPQPELLSPVRVAAHAFGPGRPARPLLLSPDHAIYFEDVLIPVRYLIDGKAIRQLAPRRVTYWHVELDRHDAILAEGLPVESYLDTGQRHAFENGGSALMLHPDFGMRVWEAEGVAPLVVTGPQVASARAAIQSVSARRPRRRQVRA